MTDRILSEEQTRSIFGEPRRTTWYHLRKSGVVPAPVPLHGRVKGYLESEVEAAVAHLAQQRGPAHV
jgi:predicted DNA-binding transcriptional regulator AlpA